MITVWGRKTSSNVQAVLWCLEELGLKYNRIDAGLTYGVTDTAEYLSINPNGVVPTLQDDANTPIFESCAICRYLSSSYACEQFWPANLAERAVVDMWAEWAKLNVAQNFSVPLFWPKVRLAPEESNADSIKAALDKLDNYLAIADAQLASSKYLASENLTLADIIFGHTLFRYFDIDLQRTEFSNIERYYNTLQERSAYREVVMVSYDELRYKP